MSEPSKSISIRAGSVEDLDVVQAIIAQVVPVMNAAGNFQWNDTYPLRANFEKDLENKELWVACNEGRVVGVIVCSFETPEEYAALGDAWDVSLPCLVPHRMAVDPAVKGLGIAKALLTFAEDLALSRGLDRIRVDTCTRNAPTMSLFPKLGYAAMGEIQLRGKAPDLWFMCFEKILKS
jgi:ribosomal protein S18 acetylase RimI-like enzyme